jgi:hypothetical protein
VILVIKEQLAIQAMLVLLAIQAILELQAIQVM